MPYWAQRAMTCSARPGVRTRMIAGCFLVPILATGSSKGYGGSDARSYRHAPRSTGSLPTGPDRADLPQPGCHLHRLGSHYGTNAETQALVPTSVAGPGPTRRSTASSRAARGTATIWGGGSTCDTQRLLQAV